MLALLSLGAVSSHGQTTDAACPAAPAALNSTATNIFTAHQEQDLGDAYAQIIDAHLRFVNDPAAVDYLDRIGKKLLAVLPPTELHFSYKIVDSYQVNAWSTAGGHIYFTRKLMVATANEDEIAGVLAHELGHSLIHQMAIQTTKDLKYALNVTSVGDRADIFDKIQRLRDVESEWYGRPYPEREERVADAVAVYALMKAGYQPGAYAEFWNLIAQTKGRTGSVLETIFHTTRPNEQRLRAILRDVSMIPARCTTATAASTPPEFVAMRKQVAADPTTIVEGDSAKAIQLDPPLRSDFTWLRFSPDGRYALAQDRSSIFVLGRSPSRLLFRIDAEDAEPASFSPDSTRISFSTSSMRVEEWDLATHQLAGAHDVLAYKPCLLHLLSPDGHVMACVQNTSFTKPQLGLTLWDVGSGDVIVQKDEAFDLTMNGVNFGLGFEPTDNYSWLVTYKLHWPLVRWAFTPDGKQLMVNHEPSTLVYDVQQHDFVKAGGAVARLNRKPFALLGNDRIVIDNWDYPHRSAVYSFPDGKELKQVAMGSQELISVTRGDYVMLTPMKDAPVGLLDLNSGQVPFKMANQALDVYDNTVAMESGDGGVAFTNQGLVAGAKGSDVIDLPLGDLGDISAVAVSADGKFLALSNESRCAIWNMETGERILAMRPFSGGYFDEADQFYGDFPKYRGQDHVQASIDPRQRRVGKLPYQPADAAEQKGDVLLEYKGTDQGSGSLEARDVKTNKVLWSLHSVDARTSDLISSFRWIHQSFEGIPQLTSGAAASEMVITFDTLFQGPGARELKAHPELVAHYKSVKNNFHGFLVEVIDKHTGAYVRGVVADVPHHPWDTDRPRAAAFGDFALVQSRIDSVVVYRFSTGARLGEVYGKIVAQDAASGLFCVSNGDHDLIVYDAATLGELKQLNYAKRVSFAEFLPARKELLVLTADQKLHLISVNDLQADSSNRTASAVAP